MKIICGFLLAIISLNTLAQKSNYVKDNYVKQEASIPMRDGVHLYTAVYIPKDTSQQYPILMERTPYSAGPYGPEAYPFSLGPGETLMKEKYIFVIQDVRGRYMSEGINLEVTPHIANKKNKQQVDESSDTYDTMEWLLKHITRHNGRAGLYGISYPGFYATASLPDAHPAIKAVSPQAPVTDEFMGDDANHNGAFFLMDNFGFMNYFGKPRSGPVSDYGDLIFTEKHKDSYRFFLDLGPVKNTNGKKYFNRQSYIWDEYLLHDTYDAYWKARNIRQHLKNITIPTLVVGGWFDAEDLFGALRTYEAIEKQSPGNSSRLVMGPWTHGAWAAPQWKNFGPYQFGTNTAKFFQDSIETPFFNFYLKDKGRFDVNEATVYETGSNQWRSFSSWPPPNSRMTPYYFSKNQELSTLAPAQQSLFSSYVSDPANPVPYTSVIRQGRNNGYMAEDQRFAAIRPDVLSFSTEPLTEDMTIAGPVTTGLYVTTTGTDADFIVKLIDVQPAGDASDTIATGPAQVLVRADVMRGKFRKSFEKPVPFVPGKVSLVKFTLNDALHTFKKGHRIMIQVQSSWFPLVDRNPQKFMRIPQADEKDFQKATIRTYHDVRYPSSIVLPMLQ